MCIAQSSIIAQQAYFIDGYHGGVYGHYPIEWKTKFITDLINDNPEWRMSLEIEPETWDVAAKETPDDYLNFKKIATSNRVEFTNPTYAQPYCYNISGESIIRHFDYGIKSIRKHFPAVEFNTYSVEEPCFTSSLPQILKQFGFKYAVLKCPNTCWGGYTAPYGGELVNWIGPDGTSILTVPRYEVEELEDNSVWQTTAWGNDSKYIEASLNYGIKNPVGMTLQDAGWNGGPWIGTGSNIKNNSIYATWKEYFEDISTGKTEDNYHLSQEDIRVSLMWGSQVLQRIARQVRQSENNIIMAEKMGVIANITNGYSYDQKDIDEAWRTLMLAQHHDSWIVPYNNLYEQTTWADAISDWTKSTNMISNNITSSAINSFNNETDEENGTYLRLYNTLGVSRREIVSSILPDTYIGKEIKITDSNGNTIKAHSSTIDNNHLISFEADVPAFGYATYHIEAKKNRNNKSNKANKDKHTGDLFVLENNMYRITLDSQKGGIIKSLIAKKENNKEFVDTNSDYSIGELRGFFYEEDLFHSSKDASADITIITNNEFEKSIQINGHIASHPFTQVITIKEGQKKIDFNLTIDWEKNVGIGEYAQDDAFSNNRRAFYDDRFKLNVLFPVSLNNPTLYKNTPFDVCKSELDNTHFNTWDSIKHNIILNWLDLSEDIDDKHGFTLLSDHTTSYSYGDDFPLALTVQYSGNGLWGRDYLIDSPTNIKFAIIPHSNTWDEADISNESIRWNEPLISEYTNDNNLEDISLINIDGTGYELSASYLSDNDLIVRLFNASGDGSPQIIKLDDISFSSIEEVDLKGNLVANIDKINLSNNLTGIELDMPRFGIKTIKLVR